MKKYFKVGKRVSSIPGGTKYWQYININYIKFNWRIIILFIIKTMFQAPQWITLWEYQPNVLQAVEEKGGKLWMLEVISSDEELVDEIRVKTRINIKTSSIPLCIEWDYMNEREYSDLLKVVEYFSKFENSTNGSHIKENFMLRASIGWDFRSLVDVFPSPLVQSYLWIDWVNKGIETIMEKVSNIDSLIKRYANWTGVPYDKSKLRIWVVPEYNFQAIVTVTENIHWETLFLDTHLWQDFNWWWQKIDSEEYNIWDIWWEWEKYKILLSLLRKKWILDTGIAYQLEIWIQQNGQPFLLQVKEFAKKTGTVQINSWVKWFAHRMMSTLWEGVYNFPVFYWDTSVEWFASLRESWVSSEVALILWENDRKLNIYDYDPNVVAFFHGDSHGGVFNHNSFRSAQSTLQKWWIVCMWTRDLTRAGKWPVVEQVEWNNSMLNVEVISDAIELEIEGWKQKISAREKLNRLMRGQGD